MRSITYVSSASRLMDVPELSRVLEEWRLINTELGLTGLLLYRGGNIIQTLEGPDDALQVIFDKILDDPRHKDVFVILNREIDRPSFPDWSMGFHNVGDVSLEEIDGYSTFLTDPERSPFGDSAEPASRMLQLFKENMR